MSQLSSIHLTVGEELALCVTMLPVDAAKESSITPLTLVLVEKADIIDTHNTL